MYLKDDHISIKQNESFCEKILETEYRKTIFYKRYGIFKLNNTKKTLGATVKSSGGDTLQTLMFIPKYRIMRYAMLYSIHELTYALQKLSTINDTEGYKAKSCIMVDLLAAI